MKLTGNHRRPGTVVGSLGYAAPEQLNGGQVGFATDLYGLGATCIHLLTGQSPLELYDLLDDRWCWQAALPQPVSAGLTQILDRLLARSPEARYPSASEVLKDLKALAPRRQRSRRVFAGSTRFNRGMRETKKTSLINLGM